MQRYIFLERLLKDIYGGEMPDDATITIERANTYLNEALASAAKQNYAESIKVDNISYVNNAFYSTFSDISITKSANDATLFTLELPQMPVGIGRNEGVASLVVKDGVKFSLSGIPLSINQQSLARKTRPIPNKLLYWNEGKNIFIISAFNLQSYKAIIRMISGGSEDLDSEMNMPDEWLPFINDYIMKQLLPFKNQQQDTVDDGLDKP